MRAALPFGSRSRSRFKTGRAAGFSPAVRTAGLNPAARQVQALNQLSAITDYTKQSISPVPPVVPGCGSCRRWRNVARIRLKPKWSSTTVSAFCTRLLARPVAEHARHPQQDRIRQRQQLEAVPERHAEQGRAAELQRTDFRRVIALQNVLHLQRHRPARLFHLLKRGFRQPFVQPRHRAGPAREPPRRPQPRRQAVPGRAAVGAVVLAREQGRRLPEQDAADPARAAALSSGCPASPRRRTAAARPAVRPTGRPERAPVRLRIWSPSARHLRSRRSSGSPRFRSRVSSA